MLIIGRIRKELYREISADITTDEVIITPERIEHSNLHEGAFDQYRQYIPDMLFQPDIIIKDKRPNTAVLIKRIDLNGINLELVLRLHDSSDLPQYKNSILSFWMISENRRKRYERNKQVVYRMEDV